MYAVTEEKSKKPLKPNKKEVGFPAIISSIVNATPGNRLEDAINNIVSLEGRQSIAFGLKALTEFEFYLFEKAAGLEVFAVDELQERLEWNSGNKIFVGIYDYGRPYIGYATDNQIPDKAFLHIAGVCLVPEKLKEVIEQYEHHTDKALDDDMYGFLNACSPDELEEVVNVAFHAVDHVDPAIIFVHDDTFTNFGNYNNILNRNDPAKSGYVFGDWNKRDLSSWHYNQTVYAFGYNCLIRSGYRGEEFSGNQLTLKTLNQFLDKKIEELVFINNDIELTVEKPNTLIEKADLVGRLKKQVRKDYFAYRFVNGLNFNKKLMYSERKRNILSIADVPLEIAEYLKDNCETDIAQFDTIDALFNHAAENLVAAGNEVDASLQVTPVEQLLEAVVRSATYHTQSEIGMTRGPRNLREWVRLLTQGNYEELSNQQGTDYYCAVWATPETEEILAGQGKLSKILYAISGRMCFNSWHYTPGHFPKDKIPEGRHYYYPPTMSDTAVWSDQHHAGHTLARVRYSIRSPAGLILDDKKYYGLVDMRVMRTDSKPYSHQDLRIARQFTAYLRAIYQGVYASAQRHGRDVPVQAFSKRWYENTYRTE
ncbi:hypothetical protein [Aliikangiella maris]|uniref:Uncharacterized protein n=2 Tax=Aliikangiella maris TaxID=3162458 RepID=A0ABV2BPQ6_9GAMM